MGSHLHCQRVARWHSPLYSWITSSSFRSMNSSLLYSCMRRKCRNHLEFHPNAPLLSGQKSGISRACPCTWMINQTELVTTVRDYISRPSFQAQDGHKSGIAQRSPSPYECFDHVAACQQSRNHDCSRGVRLRPTISPSYISYVDSQPLSPM